MSMTGDLISLIRNKPVSEADLQCASLFVLDTIGCAVGAVSTTAAEALRAVATPHSADVARRAFYFGGLSHVLELDDLHRTSVTHPGCVVIPAAWAIAESQDVSGPAFLKAILHGYEACARIGNSVGKAHYRIWHNTSTCGPFGSAMAVASLIGLNDEQTMWALGNAGTQSSGLWQFMETGAMSKHLHTARAAESGVLAALLAQQGFTGPNHILEGAKGFYTGFCKDPDPAAVLRAPGGPWEIWKTSIKPWPCCRHTHPAIDGAISLVGQIGKRAILEINISTYQAAIDVCDRPQPNDPYSAKFSLQHCVASALMHGRIDQDTFNENGRNLTKTLRSKVTLTLSPDINAKYPNDWGTDIEVTLSDGSKISAHRKHCKGDPENPVNEQELRVKVHELLVAGGMKPANVEAMISAVLDLPNGRPVRELKLFA
jgi:2-methylcitrate dehydratase PrpD